MNEGGSITIDFLTGLSLSEMRGGKRVDDGDIDGKASTETSALD